MSQPEDSRRPHDLHVGSSDRADLLDDPEEKKLDQRRGRILLNAFIAQCVRLSENVNDFVERLLDEGALTERSATGERCVHFGDSLLDCQQCCHILGGALRAVEETVDDNVFTLAGLSSDPLKEKHLTTKSGRRRKLCDDNKKASTSEIAAKRMKTENLLRHKRLRETLSNEMLAY